MTTLTKRQKQLLDYVDQYINEHGYAPTLQEVGNYFGLSSLATVHKHLRNLETKGYIKRKHNHSRALEVPARRKRGGAQELPLYGHVAAGAPIEAIEGQDTINVPEDFIRRDNTYCLRVRGESMVEEGIRDGDYIIVEGRDSATPQTNSAQTNPVRQNVATSALSPGDLHERIEHSRRLAASVQRALYATLSGQNPGLRDRGVKEASYVVLTETAMPGILAEVSFVSSPTDEQKLRSDGYREQIAEALYKGIARYAASSRGVKMASAAK